MKQLLGKRLHGARFYDGHILRVFFFRKKLPVVKSDVLLLDFILILVVRRWRSRSSSRLSLKPWRQVVCVLKDEDGGKHIVLYISLQGNGGR